MIDFNDTLPPMPPLSTYDKVLMVTVYASSALVAVTALTLLWRSFA